MDGNDLLMDMLKNKEDTIKFLIQTIESNNKMGLGLRKIIESENQEFKLKKLLEVVTNQTIQIKHLSLLLLIYAQGSKFDGDLGTMLTKMGRGEEALREMINNKFK